MFGALLIASALAGQPAATDPAVPTAVSIPMNDGRGPIAADVYGSGQRAVLLLHGGRRNKGHWTPQAEVLARAGFRVMAIDFRVWAKPGADGDRGCGFLFESPQGPDVLEQVVRFLNAPPVAAPSRQR